MNKEVAFFVTSFIFYFIAGSIELISPLVHFMYADKFLFSAYQEDNNISFSTQGIFLLVTGSLALISLLLSILVKHDGVQSCCAAISVFLIIVSTCQEFYFFNDSKRMPNLIKNDIKLYRYRDYDDIPTESDIKSAKTAYLALGIIKAITILAPVMRAFVELDYFLFMLIFTCILGILFPHPIYSGYIVLSPNYSSVLKNMGFFNLFIIIFIAGFIILIGIIAFITFIFFDKGNIAFICLAIGILVPGIISLVLLNKKP